MTQDLNHRSRFDPGSALESYSRSAAAELGPHGITVNIVSPGPVQSGYIPSEAEGTLITDIPLKRIGRPEDIANAVVFFARDLTPTTGAALPVDGGNPATFSR